MEEWKDGKRKKEKGKEGRWEGGKVERWKDGKRKKGKREGWKDGKRKKEKGKEGRLEGWKDGKRKKGRREGGKEGKVEGGSNGDSVRTPYGRLMSGVVPKAYGMETKKRACRWQALF